MLINMGALGAIKTDDGWDFADEPAVIVGKVPSRPLVVAPPSPLPRARGAAAGVLDKFLPVKVGSDGKATIFGLPPAVVYAVVAMMIAGGGYYAYRSVAGGRRVLNPGKKQRKAKRGRGKR